MNISRLSQFKLKNILLFLCIVFFAYVMARRLPIMIGEGSLGSIFRNSIPAGLFLVLIVLIYMVDFSSLRITSIFSWVFSKPNFNLTYSHLVLSIVSALIMGVICYKYLTNLGSTLFVFLIMFVAISFFGAVLVSIKFRPFFGFMIFLCSVPMLYFLEKKFIYKAIMSGESILIIKPFVITPMYMIVLALLFVSVFKNILERKGFFLSPIVIPIFIYMAIMLLTSMISSQDKLSSLMTILEAIPSLLCFLIVVNSVQTRKDLELTLLFMLICLVGVSFISFYFYIRGSGFGSIEISRARGDIAARTGGYQMTYIISIIFGSIMSISLIEIYKKKLIKRLSILSAIYFSIYLIIIQSFGALISIMFGSILLIKNSSYKKVYLFIFILILVLTMSSTYLQNIITTRFQNVEFNFSSLFNFYGERLRGLKAGLRLFRDYPLVGVGAGMESKYVYRYQEPLQYYVRDSMGRRQLITDYMGSHNFYVGTATQSGIIGVISLLYLLISILKTSFKTLRSSIEKREHFINLTLFGVIISFYVEIFISPCGLFNQGPNFIIGGIFWSVVGLVCVSRRLQVEEQSSASV